MPSSSPGIPGRRVSTARWPAWCGGGAGAGRGGRASGWAARWARPRRRISATSAGRVLRLSLSCCAVCHSRRCNWPACTSQRISPCSPRPCSSACAAAQSPCSSCQVALNSWVVWAMASSRPSAGCRSMRRSRCHSRVRSTCSAIASALRVVAGRFSAPTTLRSAAQAWGSPKSASAGGSWPCASALRQRCTSARRWALWSAWAAAPVWLMSAGSHSVRGSVASWW